MTLNQTLPRRCSLQAGFSLMELAIYMAIVGLLAVGAYTGYMYLFGEAQETQTMTKLRMVRDGINQFYLKTSRYPTKIEDLYKKPQDEFIAKKWRRPFVEKEDTIDAWGNKIVYKPAQGPGKKYELYSHGPNGPTSPKSERITL